MGNDDGSEMVHPNAVVTGDEPDGVTAAKDERTGGVRQSADEVAPGVSVVVPAGHAVGAIWASAST
jgi:hypothetical protein